MLKNSSSGLGHEMLNLNLTKLTLEFLMVFWNSLISLTKLQWYWHQPSAKFHLLHYKTLWPIRIYYTLSLFEVLISHWSNVLLFLNLKAMEGALGIMGRSTVLHFPPSKGKRRSKPMLVRWNSCTTHLPITCITVPAADGWRQVGIRWHLVSTLVPREKED